MLNTRTLCCLIAAVVAALAGCSLTGYEKAEAKVESLMEFRTQLDAGKQQIDVTVNTLDEIVASGSTDPRPAYNKYVVELAKVSAMAQGAKDKAAAMKTNADVYFSAWEEGLSGIQNPEIAKRGEEQKALVRAEFTKIAGMQQELADAWRPLDSNLQDIKKYLDTNLNETGIAAIADMIPKTKESAAAVKAKIEPLMAALATTAGGLAPTSGGAVPPVPTDTAK